MAGDEHDAGSFVDLDVAPALSGVRPPRLRTARVHVLVVALLLLVASVLASVATYRWQAWRDDRARESVLLMTAMVPAANPEGSFSVDDGVDEPAAFLPTSLVIVNSGPLPVEVTEVVAAQDGLSVAPAEGAKLIRPGIGTIGVIVTLSCTGSGVPEAPLPLTMRVRTPDGQTREVVSSLTVRGTPWAAHLDGMCGTGR